MLIDKVQNRTNYILTDFSTDASARHIYDDGFIFFIPINNFCEMYFCWLVRLCLP